MRIEELLIESYNLEEGPGWDAAKQGLGNIAQGAGQVAQGALKGAGAVAGGAAKAGGAVAGGLRGAWDKAKQGFQAGRKAVGGDAVPGTNPNQQQQQTNTPQNNQQQNQQQGGQQNQQQQAPAVDKETQTKVQALEKEIVDVKSQLAQMQQQQQQAASAPEAPQQQAASAPEAPQEPAPNQAGANAFGQMANTLSNPAQEQEQGQEAPPAGQQAAPATEPAPANTKAPSKQDKKAMKNQYKADVDAAQAAASKPGFQQDAMDKLAQSKVNLGDGPKFNAYGKQYEGFESRFLGMTI